MAGTRFDDIYTLFLFDRALRKTTFHFTIEIEALFRNTCVYCFADAHRGTEDYLLPENFADRDEYKRRGLRDYDGNLAELHKVLQAKAKGSRRDNIQHHRVEHGGVPLWVLATDLTFGNMEHFFNLMRGPEQMAVCKAVVEACGAKGGKRGFLSPDKARSDINTIVKVRNMCAHDERLYCARIGTRKGVDFAGFMRCAARFLSETESQRFYRDVRSIIETFSKRSETASHIMGKMGLSDAPPHR